MNDGALASTIRKLAIAGEQAGFTLDEMIRLLNAGVTVGALLDVIASRLLSEEPDAPASSSRWVM